MNHNARSILFDTSKTFGHDKGTGKCMMLQIIFTPLEHHHRRGLFHQKRKLIGKMAHKGKWQVLVLILLFIRMLSIVGPSNFV
jgi:hypothetical protein